MRRSLPLAFVVLLACAGPAPVKPPPAARCPSWADDARRATDALTVSFVLHVDAPSCKTHPEPRVLRLEVDGEPVRAISIPCEGPDGAVPTTLMMPDPGIEVEPFVVTDGVHRFTVVDPQTHDEDVEFAAVPHVELAGNGITIGNAFEVVEIHGALRMRGPVTMRMPGR